ncbi:YiiX/YebB-like N1pC/P60 family cysteine hydrolase [Leuconostoc citreum]
MVTLQAADLLFVRNQHDGMDDAIAAATGDYVHVGIVVDETHVIHASPKYGVATQTLAQFLSDSPHPDLYRPEIQKHQAENVIAQAKTYEGLSYNKTFYPDGDGTYCSQLVELAFQGMITFPTQPLHFNDDKQEVSDYWQHYYDKLNVAVPINQPGSNPEAMAKDKNLKFIDKL